MPCPHTDGGLALLYRRLVIGRLGPKDAVGTVAGCGQVLSVRRPWPEVANHLAVPFYFGGWSASLSGLVVQCHLVHRNPPVQALDEVSDQSHGRSGLILHQRHSGMRREQRTAIRLGSLDAHDSSYLLFGFPTCILAAKDVDSTVDDFGSLII
jgi:hypothetical protein